jgi:hypothetical protein
MKLFANKIGLKSITMDQIKDQKPQPQRSLDDILAGLQKSKTPEVKTAAAEPVKEVKTAAVAPKAEVKTAAAQKPTVSVKVASDFDKKPEVKQAAAPKGEIKVAKSLDFREWEPQQYIQTWRQYKNYEGCVAGVQGKASDPANYCSLLRTATKIAVKAVKQAAAKAEVKTAAQAPKAEFKKFASLPAKEKAFLREYYSKFYGADYVKALLGE